MPTAFRAAAQKTRGNFFAGNSILHPIIAKFLSGLPGARIIAELRGPFVRALVRILRVDPVFRAGIISVFRPLGKVNSIARRAAARFQIFKVKCAGMIKRWGCRGSSGELVF